MGWRPVSRKLVRYRIGALAVTAVSFAVVYFACRMFLSDVLDWAGGWARFDLGKDVISWVEQLGAFGLGLAAAGAVWQRAVAWTDRASRPATADADTLAGVAHRLAATLLVSYAEQERRHGIGGPVELKVHFSSTARPAASRAAVTGVDGIDWQDRPLRGYVSQVGAVWRDEVPSRQLVVLGEPGSGKSVLAVMLARQLLSARGTGDPVPVLVPIASWNPAAESVPELLARRLVEEFPWLVDEAAAGVKLVDQLVREPRIDVAGGPPGWWLLPVFDGLDELPAGQRERAFRRLDEYAHDHPLVVTCRSREYSKITERARLVIAHAAVVELETVDTTDVATYLSHPAHVRQLWQPVLDDLRDRPSGPLARTLATPLMVALARVAYQRPGTDPAELTTLPIRQQVVERLVDLYVEAVYHPDEPALTTGGRPRRVYTPAEAGRWLGLLAYHSYLSGTRDLLLARLPLSLMSPRPERTWPIWLGTAALTLGLVVGVSALPGAPGPVEALLWAALVALASSSARLHWGRWSHIPFGSLAGLATGVAVGTPLSGALAGLVTGLVAAAAGVPALAAEPPAARTVGALRGQVLRALAWYGVLAGAVFAVATTAQPLPASGAVVAAGTFGVGAALGSGGLGWLRFRLAHLRLARRGWLPPRLSAFVDDAYERGVLRRNGVVWQFRHATIQDNLYLPVLRYDLEHRARNRWAGTWAAFESRSAGDIVELRRMADQGDGWSRGELVEFLRETGNLADLRQRADSDPKAAAALISVLWAQEQPEEAVATARRWAESGDWRMTHTLAELLHERGGLADEIDAMRARARANETVAVQQLAAFLWQHDDLGGAIETIRPLATKRDPASYELLAVLHDAAGDLSSAASIWALLVDRGYDDIQPKLAKALRGLGAEKDLRARARRGDGACARELATLLIERHRVDEAMEVLRRRADVDDWPAAVRLVGLLREQGDYDEAIAVLRHRSDDPFAAGGWHVTEQLVDVMLEQGNAEDAYTVLRVRADKGERQAALHLAKLYDERGDTDRAMTVLRGQRPGGQELRRALARLLRRRGELSEAADVLEGTGTRDHYAARELAEVLRELGEPDRAAASLRPIAVEHWRAAVDLAAILRERGSADEATAVLWPLADQRDWPAARDLAEILIERGRPADAAAVLRPLAAGGQPEAVARLAAIGAATPAESAAMAERAAALHTQAIEQAADGQRPDALRTQQEAITLWRELAAHDPDRFDTNLMSAVYNHSVWLDQEKRHAEALFYSREAVAIQERLCGDDDESVCRRATQWENHAAIMSALGRRQEALAYARDAVTVLRPLVLRDPDTHLPDFAQALWIAVWVHLNLGPLRIGCEYLQTPPGTAETVALAEEAVTAYERLAAADPGAYASRHVASRRQLAQALQDVGRVREAANLRALLAQQAAPAVEAAGAP